MANVTTVVITLRKDVPNESQAEAVINQVKALLIPHPDITMTAHVTTRFDLDTPT